MSRQHTWPFVTRRSYMLAGQRHVWHSRPHRKGLDGSFIAAIGGVRHFWHSRFYNWLIGATFAAGAFLFMLASVWSLWPQASPGHLASSIFAPTISSRQINITFFLGSIPFTIAAFLQMVQAANSSRLPEVVEGGAGGPKFALIGWYPRNAGWLSSFTQFLGTLAFNLNTFDAVVNPARWYLKDIAIWLPNMVGSILFLASGYLAFIEAGHRYWSWHPRDLGWQIVFINLLGCVCFMTAALLAYYPSGPVANWITTVSTAHTLTGAACFFLAALLLCRESRGNRFPETASRLRSP